MKTLELFSGTKSFSKIMKAKGHSTLTIDNDRTLNPDMIIDLLAMQPESFSKDYELIWASPPCTAFSVASISHHWKGGWRKYIPKTKEAELGLKLLEKTIEIIAYIKPRKWYMKDDTIPKLEETSIQEEYDKIIAEAALASKMEIPYDDWKARWKLKDFCTLKSVLLRDKHLSTLFRTFTRDYNYCEEEDLEDCEICKAGKKLLSILEGEQQK